MRIFFFAFAVLIFNNAKAQNDTFLKADAILHVWETEKKDGKMQMLKSGDN